MSSRWRGLVVLLRGAVHHSSGREQLRVDHQRGRHTAHASRSEGRGHDHKTVVRRGTLGAVQQGRYTAYIGREKRGVLPPPLYTHGKLQVSKDARRRILINRTGGALGPLILSRCVLHCTALECTYTEKFARLRTAP